MTIRMTADARVAQIRAGAAAAAKAFRDTVTFHAKNGNTESLEQARRDLAHAEAEVKILDDLTDLEVLHRHHEMRQAEMIATRDRYMALLVEQRKHGETVRASVLREVHERLDMLACQAVSRKAQELTAVLAAIDALPARANADQVAHLKKIASDTQQRLRLIDAQQAQDPATTWRLDDNRDLVHAGRSVLSVLRARPGVSADDVIRLVGEALTPNGNLRDLFQVAGPIAPQPKPAFLDGAYWREEPTFCAFEPPAGARIVAYNIGDVWHLDLHSTTGALLAYGNCDEADVAALAPALVARAAEWAIDPGGGAWKRFATVAEQTAQVVAV